MFAKLWYKFGFRIPATLLVLVWTQFSSNFYRKPRLLERKHMEINFVSTLKKQNRLNWSWRLGTRMRTTPQKKRSSYRLKWLFKEQITLSFGRIIGQQWFNSSFGNEHIRTEGKNTEFAFTDKTLECSEKLNPIL